MSNPAPIRIAIIGGGLAGAVLANALQKHPHLSIDIFESAPEFSERGAAVGIATNGQSALAQIGGPITDVIERAGGVVMASTRLYMGSGPSVNSIVFDNHGLAQPGLVVHRAALLSELLKSVNEKSKHTNKKVVKIEEVDKGGVVIHFTDKSTFSADAVIGADGVRGFVRGHILGPNHPATAAKKAGLWDCRILVPMAKAKELLGEEPFAEDRQYGFIGNGGFIMHDVLDNGATVQCIISMPTDETWAEDEWSKPLDRVAIEKSVQEWDDSPLKKGIVQVMLENPDLKAYAQTHHAVDAPTFAKGCTCMMGDAAHAATPWQGSGASMAIEDAMVLETLLGEVKDVSHIDAAFRVYDQMRRERTQGVVHSSFGTAQILCGVGEGTGLDPEKIREGLLTRWGPIYKLDMGEHKKEALEKFRAMI